MTLKIKLMRTCLIIFYLKHPKQMEIFWIGKNISCVLKNQARAKSNIISELSEKRAFIMVDWAMKFLPRKYCEGQTDWFAKRGINWHIAVCLTQFHKIQ